MPSGALCLVPTMPTKLRTERQTVTPNMCRIVPTVLNTILSERKHSALDLAVAAGCSDNMIYKVRNEEGNAELNTSKIQALSLYLCEHEDTRIARCFIPPTMEIRRRITGTGNGRVDDDITRAIQALGQAATHFAAGDGAKMDADIAAAEQALADLKAERDRL